MSNSNELVIWTNLEGDLAGQAKLTYKMPKLHLTRHNLPSNVGEYAPSYEEITYKGGKRGYRVYPEGKARSHEYYCDFNPVARYYFARYFGNDTPVYAVEQSKGSFYLVPKNP